MRIAIVHPFLDRPRGAELQLSHLARVLLKRGHDVDIYTFRYNAQTLRYSEFLDGARIRESITPHWKHPRLVFDLLNTFALSRRLDGYDIVNPHNHPSEWVSGCTSTPCVWICNEPPPWEYQRARLSISTKAKAKIHARLTSRLARILAIDPNIGDLLEESDYQTEIEVIWSGAELLHPVVHRDNGIIDILCVGPLHPQKRPFDILEVFRRTSSQVPAILHMIGRDFMGGRVQREARKQGLAVKFSDEVPTPKLYSLYALADVALFLPERQPWGVFPLEAILSGIPTVVSRDCGFLQRFKDTQVPTVPTGDLDRATESVMDIVTNIEYWRKQTATLANRLKPELTWDAYGERVESQFVNVLESFRR